MIINFIFLILDFIDDNNYNTQSQILIDKLLYEHKKNNK